MSEIASVLNHLLFRLGEDAYHPKTARDAANCLIDVYHGMTWKNNKDRIVLSLKQTGIESIKRIVIATTALSMGVNFPDIRYIINWGPARNLLDYHQQAGRAGRDGNKSHVIVIYHGQMLSHCEPDVKSFVKSMECYRVASLCPLDENVKPLLPGHDCCSNCCQYCVCNGDTCTSDRLSFEDDITSAGDEVMPISRDVSDTNKLDLHSALEEITEHFSSQGSLVLPKQVQMKTISELVEHSPAIFTVKDIVDNFPVFSLEHTLDILEVFNEIFEDIHCLTEIAELLQDCNFDGTCSSDSFEDVSSISHIMYSDEL